MTDINLLKDTDSTEEGKGLSKNRPPKDIELSKPSFKAATKRSLAEEAPESFWSKLFGRRQKKPKEESPDKVKEEKRRSVKIGGITTVEPVVMASSEKLRTKERPLKGVKIPLKPGYRKMEEIEPLVKPETNQEENSPIFEEKETEASLIIPPLSQAKIEEKNKAGFWSRIFRKPKITETPQAVPLEAKTQKGKTGRRSVEEEVGEREKPIQFTSESEPGQKQKEEEIILPKELLNTKSQEGFFKRLFKKPQIDKLPVGTQIAPTSEKAKKKQARTTEKEEREELSEASELAPSALEVDLMPEELEANILLAKRRLMQLGFIALGTVVFIAIVYFGLMFYESNLKANVSKIEQEITLIKQEIEVYRPVQAEAISTKQKTDAIKNLLDKHVYWTNFFNKLEYYTVDNVYYTNMSGDLSSGQITLTARAKSFLDVGRQLLVFQEADDFVDDVAISSARMSSEQVAGVEGAEAEVKSVVEFSITLSVISAVFNYSEEVKTE